MNSKRYEDLTIQDNFIFTKVMAQKGLMIQLLKRIFPNEKIGDISYINAEQTKDEFYGSKGIRVDVYSETETELFSVEMQVEQLKSLEKRTRYQNAILDMHQLSKGKKYSELKNVYVIFISPDDPFDDKMMVYRFRNICVENGKELNDGSEKIFINCSGINGDEYPELAPFAEYVKNGEITGDSFVRELNQAVVFAKHNPVWRRDYMSLQLELWDAEERGKGVGHVEERLRSISVLMKKGRSFEEVCNDLELTPEEIEECRKQMNASEA